MLAVVGRFDQAPLLVVFEVTQACDLACRHCRASARPERHPEELTTQEAFALLEQIRAFGDPLVIFTGGDPLKRPDLFALLNRSVTLGLRTAVTPSATPLLTAEALDGFLRCGVTTVALSLDGPDAPTHDAFRGVAGSFHRTLWALDYARRIGLATQVNTTVGRHNLEGLRSIARLVGQTGAGLWSVFFLAPIGRGQACEDLSAHQYEQVFALLAEIAQTAAYAVKTTEAQHYRRFLAQRGAPAGRAVAGAVRRPEAVNAGKGFLFVSHTGEVYPSGFLPIAAGNVRRDSLVHLYRDSPLFRELRDPSRLRGKCGRCEYRRLCGGSRARAWALTGDYLESDPRCVWEPRGGPGGGG